MNLEQLRQQTAEAIRRRSLSREELLEEIRQQNELKAAEELYTYFSDMAIAAAQQGEASFYINGVGKDNPDNPDVPVLSYPRGIKLTIDRLINESLVVSFIKQETREHGGDIWKITVSWFPDDSSK